MYELFVLINDKATLYEASQGKSALKCFKNVQNPTNFPSCTVTCFCSINHVSINIISVMSVQRCFVGNNIIPTPNIAICHFEAASTKIKTIIM